jgi:hypothetical protein
MKTKHLLPFALLFLVLLTMISCAPLGATEKQYGFFYGIIHGLLLYPAIISKVLGMDFDLYAQNNTGFWYWLGFAIGVFGFGGGIFSSRRVYTRRRVV